MPKLSRRRTSIKKIIKRKWKMCKKNKKTKKNKKHLSGKNIKNKKQLGGGWGRPLIRENQLGGGWGGPTPRTIVYDVNQKYRKPTSVKKYFRKYFH